MIPLPWSEQCEEVRFYESWSGTQPTTERARLACREEDVVVINRRASPGQKSKEPKTEEGL